MATSPEASNLADWRGSRYAARGLWLLVSVLLAFLLLRFYIRDPLHYLLDHSERSFGSFWPRRWWLLLHIAGGTLALFAGPFQLWTGLRRRRLNVHRWTGRVYLLGVLLGGAGGFYLSVFTMPRDFGIALFTLAAAWWTTAGMALVGILRHQVDAHREWMIRSYVVTFAFVSFRWWIDWPVWSALGEARFATVGWLCWVAPLLAAEVALQWKRTVGPAGR